MSFICPEHGEVYPNAFDVIEDIYLDSVCSQSTCPKCNRIIKSKYGKIKLSVPNAMGFLWDYERK